MTEDYYEILHVHVNAEIEIIEAAYRRLARKYHPDVNQSPDAEERMKKINCAYEVLKDDIKRAEYDRQYKRESYKKEQPSEQKSEEYRQEEPENSGEYHYRVNKKEYYSYSPQVNPEQYSNNSLQAEIHTQPPPVTIYFCEEADENLNPVGPCKIFSPYIKQITCIMHFTKPLPIGSKIKVVWYCNDEIILRRTEELDDNYDKLSSSIMAQGFMASFEEGSSWKAYIFKNEQPIGEGNFKIASRQAYTEYKKRQNNGNGGLWQEIGCFLNKLLNK